MKHRHLLACGVLTALLLVLAGCPLPIDGAIAGRISDDVSPTVTIISPEDASTYLQTVHVSGSVDDPDGRVDELGWVVSGALGELLSGTVDPADIADDGSFTFSFGTVGFDGPIELRVRAVDWNGNASEQTLSLQYSGSELSSFIAVPGNRRVVLDWEPVEGAESYTVYYTTDASLPSQTFGTTLRTTEHQVTLTDLRNGALHTFLLSAEVPGGPAYWSQYVRAIPLSPSTLAPRVTGGYRRIELDWYPVAGFDSYEIFRAEGPEGTYTNYTGAISGSSFVDTAIADGVDYFYRVRPALTGAITSSANSGRTVQIPFAARQVRSVGAPQPTERVDFADGYAYVAAGTSGLLVYDSRDPINPILVGSLDTTDANDVVVNGQYVYLADGVDGVLAVDVSDPTNPTITDTFVVANMVAARLDVEPTMGALAVVDSFGGTTLYVLDVSTPDQLVELDSISDAAHEYNDVAVSHYQAPGSPPIDLVFIYLPGTEAILEYYYRYVTTPGLYAFRSVPSATDAPIPAVVATAGDHVYALSVVPFDIEPPSEYRLEVFTRYPDPFARVGNATELSGYVSDMVVLDGTAYTVDEFSLHLYDVSVPTAPELTYSLDTPGSPVGIDTDGEYAYVAPNTRFFQTVDLKLPTAPAVVGEYNSDGVHDVRVAGTIAYVLSEGPNRLQLLDVSALDAPTPLGSLSLDWLGGLAVSGNLVVVAERSAGLRVVDVSDPLAPATLGTAPPIAGDLEAVEIKGSFAFAASRGGLAVYDISDPENPVGVGLVDSDLGGMDDIAIVGERAYVVDAAYFQPNTLKIIDISDPTVPVLEDVIANTGVITSRVDVFGGYAFLTDELGGVSSVDIDPASASYGTQSASVDPNGATDFQADGVAAFGDYLFVTNAAEGLSVMDVSDPSTPTPLASMGAWGGSPDIVRLAGDHLFVADRNLGLIIIDLSPTAP